MTQEELDALMSGDMNDMDATAEDNVDEFEEVSKDYRPDPLNYWPPAPPSKENKVVHQLDDVTKESEEKATQLFDMLDAISMRASDAERDLETVATNMASITSLLSKLQKKYPEITIFTDGVNKAEESNKILESSLSGLQDIGMHVMNAMDTMQYQDIHRQKIERVINVMRSLSNYMNKLFEGKIDDEKRVGSAKHIHGDSTANVVDDDDIEALIASFGKK